VPKHSPQESEYNHQKPEERQKWKPTFWMFLNIFGSQLIFCHAHRFLNISVHDSSYDPYATPYHVGNQGPHYNDEENAHAVPPIVSAPKYRVVRPNGAVFSELGHLAGDTDSHIRIKPAHRQVANVSKWNKPMRILPFQINFVAIFLASAR
jgi:hypothetical protein